eukprot:747992-Rhodomonas_salina.5
MPTEKWQRDMSIALAMAGHQRLGQVRIRFAMSSTDIGSASMLVLQRQEDHEVGMCCSNSFCVRPELCIFADSIPGRPAVLDLHAGIPSLGALLLAQPPHREISGRVGGSKMRVEGSRGKYNEGTQGVSTDTCASVLCRRGIFSRRV